MVFKLVTLVSLLMTGATAKIETIPNFLDLEDIEQLVVPKEDTDLCLSEERSFRPFQLPKTLQSSLWTALTAGGRGVHGRNHDVEGVTKNGQITTLHQTTTPHVDCIMTPEGEQGEEIEDNVAFVFLNNNKQAYFTQGNQKIPVEQGKLVMFNGSEEHQTVIPENSPAVKILGPFAVSGARKLSLVGMLLLKGEKKDGKGKKGKKGDAMIDPCVFASPAATQTLLIPGDTSEALLLHSFKVNEVYMKAINVYLSYGHGKGRAKAASVGKAAGEAHAGMPFLQEEEICSALFVIVAQMVGTCGYEDSSDTYSTVAYHMMMGFVDGAGMDVDLSECEQPDYTVSALGGCTYYPGIGWICGE